MNIRGFFAGGLRHPRSFLSMGKDGILFKRFLLKDPYNPVSLGDLIRLSLGKVALFYVVLLATFAGLLRGKAERRLLVVAIWGDSPSWRSRWAGKVAMSSVHAGLPLRLRGLGPGAGGEPPMRLIQALVLLLIVVMGVVNLPALSRDRRARSRSTRTPIEGSSLRWVPKIGSMSYDSGPPVPVKRDPLVALSRGLRVGVLIPLGYASAPNWRSDFAKAFRGPGPRGEKYGSRTGPQPAAQGGMGLGGGG